MQATFDGVITQLFQKCEATEKINFTKMHLWTKNETESLSLVPILNMLRKLER